MRHLFGQLRQLLRGLRLLHAKCGNKCRYRKIQNENRRASSRRGQDRGGKPRAGLLPRHQRRKAHGQKDRGDRPPRARRKQRSPKPHADRLQRHGDATAAKRAKKRGRV